MHIHILDFLCDLRVDSSQFIFAKFTVSRVALDGYFSAMLLTGLLMVDCVFILSKGSLFRIPEF